MSTLTVIAWVVFCIADVVAYCFAAYPERARTFWYKLPGGGFVALYKFGRER
jgi:hypothetical protein